MLRSDKNIGFGAANNRSARVARGQYLVFLNPDTVAEPGWIDTLIAPLVESPGLSTPKLLFMERPDRINTCGNSVHLSGITVCRGYGRLSSSFEAKERILAVSGACFAIDRASFEQLGGFDERFFMYLEDTDLSLRAAQAGLSCWFVPDSRVRHRHAPSFSPNKIQWLERNRWMLTIKLWSARTLLGLLPALLMMEVLVWGYAIVRGPGAMRAKVASYLWLISRLPRLLKARRDTQRRRRVPDRELLARCAWRLDLTELVTWRPLRIALDLLLVGPQRTALLIAATVSGRGAAGR